MTLLGRPAAHARRDIVDAIRYVTHNSCVWRALPGGFPLWKTVYDYHARWAADGTVARLHDTLREQVRTAEGRLADPLILGAAEEGREAVSSRAG